MSAGAAMRARRQAAIPFLQAGFRPFFLSSGVLAVVAMTLLVLEVSGVPVLATHFDFVTWHIHEFLWGVVGAAMTGFLLTAVPNWTGRLPVAGWPLAGLWGLWLLARIAVWGSGAIGWAGAMAIDVGFWLVLLGLVATEIVSGRNWRNLPVVAAITLFAAANLLIHLDGSAYGELGAFGMRGGVATALALVALIGGRITPSFTRNRLAAKGETLLPAGFDRLDKAGLVLTVLGLLLWVAFETGPIVALMLATAGVAGAARLARWRGAATLGEPLLAVLHLGYAWVPAALILMAAAALDLVPRAVAIHAATAGALATMILAVMTRATLGHTGRALIADGWTTAVYVLITAAALARIAAGFDLPGGARLIDVAGGLWIAGFAIFVARYGAMMLRPAVTRSRGC